MVKLKVLLLLLALNAAISANNDSAKKENEQFPQELLSEPNIKVSKEPLRKQYIPSILRTPKMSQLSAKSNDELHGTPKSENKLVESKNSFESHKLRLHNKEKMRSRHLRNKQSLDKPPANCTKIKCPTIEKPVCAKLVLINTKENNYSKPFYVIMINKCEMNYAKCHRGLEATIVPMKNCHPKFKKTSLATAKGKRRPKRDAERNEEDPSRIVAKPANTAKIIPAKTNIKLKQKYIKTQRNTTNVHPKNKFSKPLNIINPKKPASFNSTVSKSLHSTIFPQNKTINKTRDKKAMKLTINPDLENNKTNTSSHNSNSSLNSHHKTQNKTGISAKSLAETKTPNNKINVKLIKKGNLKQNIKISTKSSTKSNLKLASKAINVLSPVKKLAAKPKPTKAKEKPQKNFKSEMKKNKKILRQAWPNPDVLSKRHENDKMFKEKVFKHVIFSKHTQKLVGEAPPVDSTAEEEKSMNLNYVANATHQQRSGPTDAEDIWKNDLKGEYDGGDDTAAYGNPEYEYEPHTGEIVPVEIDHTNTTDGDDENQGKEKDDPNYNTPYDDGITSTPSFDDVTTPSDGYGGDRGNHTGGNDNSKENISDIEKIDDNGGEQVVNEDTAACPTSCPLRDVMVCAMCQHKIYKTFASVCHMRKFQCYHKDEQLELVSRYPCVMSAPFLSGPPPMKLEGQLAEGGDVDHITRYIRCRDKGRLNKTPRCTFGESDTKKLSLRGSNKPVKGDETIENVSQRFHNDYY